MKIASRANVLWIGFMILVLGKGLTADYTNNADGKKVEMEPMTKRLRFIF